MASILGSAATERLQCSALAAPPRQRHLASGACLTGLRAQKVAARADGLPRTASASTQLVASAFRKRCGSLLAVHFRRQWRHV